MHSCEDHHHVDVPGLVAAAERRAFVHAGTVLALWLAAALALALATNWYSPWPLLLAVAGWVVASFAGAFAAALRSPRRDALVVGAAVASVAVTGTAALVVALLPGDAAAPSAALGWALAAAAFQTAQAFSWKKLLHTPGEAGEFARAQAVEGAAPARLEGVRRVLVWALPALLMAVWVLLLQISWWTAPAVLVGALAQQLAVTRVNLAAGGR